MTYSYPRSFKPRLTISLAAVMIFVELTSQPKAFQLFHPNAGNRPCLPHQLVHGQSQKRNPTYHAILPHERIRRRQECQCSQRQRSQHNVYFKRSTQRCPMYEIEDSPPNTPHFILSHHHSSAGKIPKSNSSDKFVATFLSIARQTRCRSLALRAGVALHIIGGNPIRTGTGMKQKVLDSRIRKSAFHTA